jgi:DNA-binding winged helix-turn-helix (wHTH) protein/Tol biopolymer transport system component
MPLGTKDLYEFNGFQLNAAERLLTKRGKRIQINDKAFDVLVLLVRESGHLVTKDSILATVWPNAFVEENNLDKNISLLRKALGESKNHSKYIETVRGHGYRFVAPVTTRDVDLVRPSGHHRHAVPVLSPAAPRRVARQKQGNVVALVDWLPENDPAEIPVEPEPERIKKPSRSGRLALGAMVWVLIAIGLVGWYRSASVTTTAEARGEVTIVRVTNGVRPGGAAISSDGSYIVYHETQGDTSRLWLQQVGQPSRVEIGSSDHSLFSGKSFSPDNRFIYYIAVDKDSGATTLYRTPTVGGPPSKVIDDVTTSVSFSPDGKEFAFLRIRKQPDKSELIIAAADGANERVVLQREADRQIVGGPAWSPDGRLLAFAEADLSGSDIAARCTINAIDLIGGGIKPLSREAWDTVYNMAWTFDGTGFLAIATRANEGYSTRRDQVYYISYPDGISRRLTTDGSRHDPASLGVTRDNAVIAVPFSRSSQIWKTTVGHDSAGAVQLSTGLADGRAGLAPLPNGRVGYITRNGDDLNIWIMNSDGTEQRPIAREPAILEELRPDPKGRYFVFSAVNNGHSYLFRVGADGSDLKQLTSGDSNDVDSTVSPDGGSVVYASTIFKGSKGRTTLWRTSINGENSAQLSNIECMSPSFSPDGTLISCIHNDHEVLILSAQDGSQVERFRLPVTAVLNFGAGWTHDSRGIIYILPEGDYSNIWIQPRDGSRARRLTNFTSGSIYRFALAPEGEQLYIARGYPTQDVIYIKGFR